MINITSKTTDLISSVTSPATNSRSTLTDAPPPPPASSPLNILDISGNHVVDNSNYDTHGIVDDGIISINHAVVVSSSASSDSSDSPTLQFNLNSNNSSNSPLISSMTTTTTRRTMDPDISCIDLTEADPDDEIEIINEIKLNVRPHKKRKRESKSSPLGSTVPKCCDPKPPRNSNWDPVLPILSSPRTLPTTSLPRSNSPIVDLSNSPSPSTSTTTLTHNSTTKNNVVDVLVESVPNHKNITQKQGQEEPTRFKVVKCPICLEDDNKILSSGGEIVVTVCGHVYCKSCISQAIKSTRTCPKCRRKLTQKNYHRIFL